MASPRSFPTPDVFRRRLGSLADPLVILGVLGLVYVLARLISGVTAPFSPANPPTISLDPRNLPYYAARSLLRMFIALFASTLFSLIYATAAARSRRAERVLIPLLDVLQSVPILGFLSITVAGFIALFPGSLLGLECASIFAIFTSQAWNMTFSYYHSLLTQPRDQVELAQLYRLSGWQRFTNVDLPNGMIGLVWNGMMSFGGGWFFLVASEAISVLNKTYTLPGIGSYLAAAVAAQDIRRMLLALLTMIVVIVGVDRLFWRPLVAWAEKFKNEESVSGDHVQSGVLDVLRRAHVVAAVGRGLAPVGEGLDHLLLPIGGPRVAEHVHPTRTRAVDVVFYGILGLALATVVVWGGAYVLRTIGLREVGTALYLGLLTFLRVIALLIVAAVIWTPVGVWIGFNPRVSRVAQPIVQILASFPANFLFPFVTLFFIRSGISLDYGAPLLMALGAQWYLLFNSIAGAMAIPNDLKEAARNFGVRRWTLWRTLILPGIFPAWVTGAITASGGAWNASIVAEVVSWGHTTLHASGLGAYITDATATGNWPRIALGISVMVLYVVGLNRLVWRRLYRLAETRFTLD
ncbi:MAG TPA: ABC transporter permease subunit [Thermomicrobiaceae bacterium]|nr:ABC transporter permease subunit [Thermomicrobiaceae bacterium]